MVTSDGKTVICVARASGAFQEYSTATGKLTRTLYQAGRGLGEVLWASPAGDVLIGYLNPSFFPGDESRSVVGVVTDGNFRKLSFPMASGVAMPNAIAW